MRLFVIRSYKIYFLILMMLPSCSGDATTINPARAALGRACIKLTKPSITVDFQGNNMKFLCSCMVTTRGYVTWSFLLDAHDNNHLFLWSENLNDYVDSKTVVPHASAGILSKTDHFPCGFDVVVNLTVSARYYEGWSFACWMRYQIKSNNEDLKKESPWRSDVYVHQKYAAGLPILVEERNPDTKAIKFTCSAYLGSEGILSWVLTTDMKQDVWFVSYDNEDVLTPGWVI
ncbi:hypothetical protein EGW08_005748, partial [Elysia chlorotica]